MSVTLTITVCILLLISYIFDISAYRTRIPSVLLLLIVGIIVKYISIFFRINIPGIEIILPIFGNIGLILIVLEGIMEIELRKEKIPIIAKSLILALIPLLLFAIIYSLILSLFISRPLNVIILNSIPLSVISSAIVIPSLKNTDPNLKELLIYESSISDIMGILIFNIFIQSTRPDVSLLLHTSISLLIVLITSIIATIILSRLLHSIEHHVKFTPIILLIVLIYTILKYYHLPALIFIMIFGLMLNNLNILKDSKIEKILDLEKINSEIPRFKDIVYEGTFLIRSIFFILFGFSLNITDILSINSLPLSILACLLIYLIRFISLKLMRLPVQELITMAPRGLITILLFLSIEEAVRIDIINSSVIVQVIVITIVVMSYGNLKIRSLKTNT